MSRGGRPAGAFQAAELRALRVALESRNDPERAIPCPACTVPLSERDVPTPRDLPYVRHRVWLICTGCGRSGAVDVRAGGPR